MRWPPRGSRPVVSVSITISRIVFPPDDARGSLPCRSVLTIAFSRRKVTLRPSAVATTKSARRRFSRSGIWARRISANRLSRHARPAHHPLALQAQRRRDDQREIAALDRRRSRTAAEYRARPAARAAPGPARRTAVRRARTIGWRIALEPAQRRRVAEHAPAQPPAVDAAGLVAHPGKCRLDRADRGAARAEQPMHRGIGIEQRHAEPPQHRRGGALAHADRAGEAEDDHRGAASVVSTAARNSRVTRTGAPNHASNPGRP